MAELTDGLIGHPSALPGQRTLSLIQRGSYCIVFAAETVFIARGMYSNFPNPTMHDQLLIMSLLFLTIYARSGAKTSTHAWTASAETIGSVSYIGVQLYEYERGREFRAILRKFRGYRLLTFAHLSSDCLLSLLPGSHNLSQDRHELIIDSANMDFYLARRRTMPSITNAVKALVAARRQSNTRNADDGDDNAV